MSERNNFDLVRLLLATTVFLVHTYVLTGAEPLAVLDRALSSDLAIKAFFAISGYLVLMSYENSRSALEYFEKRARRILPGYAAVVVAAALAGAMLSDRALTDYLRDGALRYLAANLAFANFVAPTLPGVFASNPQHAVNGALWTLKIEVMFYLCLPLIVVAARHFGARPVVAALYALSVAYSVALLAAEQRTGNPLYGVLARQLPGQVTYFLCGGLLYKLSPDLKRSRYAIFFAVACAYLFWAGTTDALFAPPAVSFVAIYLALGLPWLGNFGRFGDFSYGVYIVHFPILQLLVHYGAFRGNPWLAFAAACGLVFAAAALLWHLVEKPALKRASHYRRAEAPAAPSAQVP
jgi:peptidoglycan/LPS O-acetylase OafA/YrhL